MPDDLWTAATQHPFLLAVRDRTIARAAFERWLVQDYRYVADLLEFQARLLARAPRHAQRVLAEGCVAIVAELDWFTERAAERGLELDAPRLPATESYLDLLRELDQAPFDAAITALWALEQVYLDAWTAAAAPRPSAFEAFVEHWTTPEFAGYVAALRQLACPNRHPALIERVLQHEIAFWDTALG